LDAFTSAWVFKFRQHQYQKWMKTKFGNLYQDKSSLIAGTGRGQNEE